MNTSRYLIGSIAVFILVMVLEFILHAVILGGIYSDNLQLLRPQSESSAMVPWMTIGFLILSFGFCFIFLKGYEGKGIVEGLRYGLYIGVTFAVSTALIHYSVFPYPVSWVIAWIIAYPIEGMLMGMLFAAIYRPAKG